MTAKARTSLLFLFVPLTFLILVAVATYGIVSSQSANGVYDTDGDKLIEISYLEQLDAIRYDLDGDGRADYSGNAARYAAAFPAFGDAMVCNAGCKGYELTRSLDFKSDASYSYASEAVKFGYLYGKGWWPIGLGPDGPPFSAIFDGNGHTISNLYLHTSLYGSDGLFHHISPSGEVRRIGLIEVDVTGGSHTGALTGWNYGTISHSYATGRVIGGEPTGGLVGANYGTVSSSYATARVIGGDSATGGLVGQNKGTVIYSYATSEVGLVGGRSAVGGLVGYNEGGTVSHSYAAGAVRGDYYVGGLVGATDDSGSITSSYAIGPVSGSGNVGGLVGYHYSESTITNSYWNTDIQATGVGDGSSTGAEGKTTAELKAPTGNTGIYAQWNPQYWDFGTISQYPLLKADMDGDGKATWQEFGPQIKGDRRAVANTPTATATPLPTPLSTADHLPTFTPTPTATPVSKPTATPTATPRPTATPAPTPTPTPSPVLTSGYNGSCLLDSDGSASCWTSRKGDQGAPPAGAKFSAISSGYSHSCGVKTDGTIACWGSNSQGESTPPTGKFTALSSGFSHTCALWTDGTAACWGNNRSGQSTPPEDTPFTVINSGFTHTCGQRVDGVVVCWGGLSGTFGE